MKQRNYWDIFITIFLSKILQWPLQVWAKINSLLKHLAYAFIQMQSTSIHSVKWLDLILLVHHKWRRPCCFYSDYSKSLMAESWVTGVDRVQDCRLENSIFTMTSYMLDSDMASQALPFSIFQTRVIISTTKYDF